MKFSVIGSDGRSHDFVFTREKLGQEVLDRVSFFLVVFVASQCLCSERARV